MINEKDYFCEAELFYGGRGRKPGQFLTYRRFETLAEAVKFTMEEIGTGAPYASIASGEHDLRGDEIRALYESDEFPLERRLPGTFHSPTVAAPIPRRSGAAQPSKC